MKLNDPNSFYVYPRKYTEKISEKVKTKELIKQMECLSVSTSDYEPPANKTPRIRLKTAKKITNSSDSQSNLSETIRTGDESFKKPVQSHEKTEPYDTVTEKDMISDEESDETDDVDVWSPPDDKEAQKKRNQRIRKEYSDKFAEVLESIPKDVLNAILIKNGLLRIETIQNNLSLLKCDEFEKRVFHQIAMDRSWNSYEISLYARKFNQKPKDMKDIFASPGMSRKKHRKSFGQNYRNDRIDLIMKYLQENAMPNASHPNDIVMKKVSHVKNRAKKQFYR